MRPREERHDSSKPENALKSSSDVLLVAGQILGFHRPAKAITRLQALPIGRDRRTEIFGKTDPLR
jgi:hypothetical protein